ncbi:MAG: Rod shape-determining protein rodA [Parcubacteria group bacterium GW2011_GWC2_42_13]|nr:MAG: Rod shape-determining protein rodA [Parcubacteria group bacterium GW2011_GWC2_42_13]
MFKKFVKNIDWVLLAATAPIILAGLITMNTFGEAGRSYFFFRQILWLVIALGIFFAFSFIDWRFLKSGHLLFALFVSSLAFLGMLFVFGTRFKGALSWFNLGIFSAQPSEPVKLLVILVLAKYFSRRHVEIADVRHIIVSGVYAFLPAALIFFQPDFGSAVIVGLIWLGMILVSGVSKKHLLLVILMGAVIFAFSWFYLLEPYQKMRVKTFVNPFIDPQGAGYNALQSMVAVGSGQLLGKGVGFGTQSRLEFLPEYQTDFIFAAFAEEWGLVGVSLLFFFWGLLIWRILKNASLGQGNFEKFFGLGLAIFLMAHFAVHTGMNVGVLPVTGVSMPFMSYGGSHLITIFAGLGILMGMRRYASNIQLDEKNPVANLLGS